MTSSIVSMPSDIPEKADACVKSRTQSKAQSLSNYYRCSLQKSGTATRCGALARKCFGEKIRPCAGLCMIAFAVPLIVPGITLTVVAFEDDTGFPKYGALHVLGMVLLVFAILLTASGIVLNTRFQSKITNDVSTLTISNDDKTVIGYHLDTIITSNTSQSPNKNDAKTTVIAPNPISCNHHVNTEDNPTSENPIAHATTPEAGTCSNSGHKHVSFSARRGSRRQICSNKSVDDYSSSFDSFDSEDFSSGSYIISDDVGLEQPIQEMESEMGEVQEMNEHRSFSTFKPDSGKKPAFSFEEFNYNTNNVTDSKSSHFSSRSLEHSTASVNETINQTKSPCKSTKSKTKFIYSYIDGFPVEMPETSKEVPKSAPEIEEPGSSPGSRQRLYGLSSEVSVTSSDILTTSCDSLKTQEIPTLNENISCSNPSVFSLEHVTKSTTETTHDDYSKEIIPGHNSKSNNKTWAQSPPTKRPNSFPCGGEMSGSSDGMARNNSMKEKHITSLGEFAR